MTTEPRTRKCPTCKGQYVERRTVPGQAVTFPACERCPYCGTHEYRRYVRPYKPAALAHGVCVVCDVPLRAERRCPVCDEPVCKRHADDHAAQCWARELECMDDPRYM